MCSDVVAATISTSTVTIHDVTVNFINIIATVTAAITNTTNSTSRQPI